MANEHMQLNQHPDAIELYATLIRTPDGAIASEAIYHLGMLYLQQNQVDEAESIFSQSIGVGESADYYRLSSLAQLAAIYENIGKDSKAVSAYQLLVNSTSEERWVVAAEERIQALTDLKAAK
ncbi:MAG: tetratricopeptide repeat protein [Calditrichia bacterium]